MNKSPERKDNKTKKDKEKPHAKEQVKKENELNNSPKIDKEKHDKPKSKLQLIKVKKAIQKMQAEEKPATVPQNNSLVKYDTPFLVSTTINNKKAFEQADDSNESTEIFLRNLINKKSGGSDNKSDYEDFKLIFIKKK